MEANASPTVRRSFSAIGWLLVFVAVVDIVLLLASAFAAMGGRGRLINQLNLGLENNAAVWWSSATLLLAGLLLFDSAFRHQAQRNALLIIAALLAFLSLDEMGSLHERIFTGSYWSYVPYGLVGGLLFLYAFWQLYKSESLRPIAITVFIGFSCFGSVVAQEFFEHNVDWPSWAVGLRVAVEEGTELLGTALCLLCAGRLLGFDQTDSLHIPERKDSARPFAMVCAVFLLCAGVYTAMVAPSLDGYPVRGNPALWFAMAGFLILAFEVLREKPLHIGLANNWFLVGCAIAASMAQTMFVYTKVDLMWLVAANIILFSGILLALVRRGSGGLVYGITACVVLVVLAIFAVQGAAAAAFLMSLVAAAAAILLHRVMIPKAPAVS